MITKYFWFILFFLVLTLFAEGILALAFRVRGKDLLVVLLANIVTNPLVQSSAYMLRYLFGSRKASIGLVALEICAVIAEGTIYKLAFSEKKMNPFLLSMILNGVSYLLGFVFRF